MEKTNVNTGTPLFRRCLLIFIDIGCSALLVFSIVRVVNGLGGGVGNYVVGFYDTLTAVLAVFLVPLAIDLTKKMWKDKVKSQ